MEKRKLGIRLTVCIILGAMYAGLLSGCGDRKVDYMDTESSGNGQTGALAAFEAESGDRWEETLQITDGAGDEVIVNISTWISLPKADSMSVMEVKEYEYSPENKEKIARAVFGEEVYSCNFRKFIEEEIVRCEADLSSVEGALAHNSDSLESAFQEERKAEYEKEYAELMEKLENCSEELEKEIDFEDDSFIGKLGDFYYTLSFGDDVSNGVVAFTEDESDLLYWFQKCRTISISVEEALLSEEKNSELMELMADTDRVNDVSCGETEQMILGKLEEAGLGNLVTYEIYCGQDSNRGSYDEMRKLYAAEYLYFMSTGVDGLAFHEFGTPEDYLFHTKLNVSSGYYTGLTSEVSYNYRSPEVFSMTITDPLEVISVTTDVSMLSLDDVKAILKDEITEHMDLSGYMHGSAVNLNQLDLIYFRVKDTDKDGYYSYVPAWRLSNSDYNFVVMINAIDGSVIDVAKELTVEED